MDIYLLRRHTKGTLTLSYFYWDGEAAGNLTRNDRTNPPGCRASDFSSFVIDEETKKNLLEEDWGAWPQVKMQGWTGLSLTLDTHTHTHHTLQHIRSETPCQCRASHGFTSALLLLYTAVQVETRAYKQYCSSTEVAPRSRHTFFFFKDNIFCVFLFSHAAIFTCYTFSVS